MTPWVLSDAKAPCALCVLLHVHTSGFDLEVDTFLNETVSHTTSEAGETELCDCRFE